MSFRPLLAASLALNVLLAAGLYHKTPDVRAYYMSRVFPPPPAPTPTPTPAWLEPLPPRMPRFSEQRLAEPEPAYAYGGERGAALGRWREQGRAAFGRLLSFDPRPFGGEVRVVLREDGGAFTREQLYLRSARGLWLPAFLLKPKRPGKHPAVLALPGHDGPGGYGAAAIAHRRWDKNYQRAFGARLAERGYVVLAVDVAGIGELRYLDYLSLVNHGLLVGEPLLGVMLEQAHEAMDYLLARPEVDPRRVGTAGVSLGGELAMFAAVLDPRVAFAAVSGFLPSYRTVGGQHASSLYVPGALRVADVPDLAGMVAPRPMLLQAGRQDPFFPYDEVLDLTERVRRIYAAAGAEPALAFDGHDGGHLMEVDGLASWLERVAPAQRGAAAVGRAPM